MGADLVGHLAKGPKDLTPNRSKAIKHVMDFAADCRRALAERVSDEDDLPENLKDAFSEYDYPDPWAEVEDDAEITDDHAESLVDGFIKFWESPTYRDCASRDDPDDSTQQIVFAGERTWGDRPQGDGCLAFEEADRYNIPGLLGVR